MCGSSHPMQGLASFGEVPSLGFRIAPPQQPASLMYNRLVNAPTSVVGHDDLEMYERAQAALRSRARDWVNVARLFDPAELDQGTAVTNGTNEWQMRSQYRNWARYMTSSMGG